MDIKRLEDISLSVDDVMRIVNGKANFISYDKLISVNDLDELLDPYGSCLLLYLTDENYGHFCCLNKINKNEVEFFDPYGIFVDNEFEDFEIDEHFNKKKNQDRNYLSYLMYKSPYKLSYNEHQFQKKNDDIKTCGRHCGIRMLLKHMPLKEYSKLMFKNGYGDPDTFVTILTADIP
jgi:hypothetical protein